MIKLKDKPIINVNGDRYSAEFEYEIVDTDPTTKEKTIKASKKFQVSGDLYEADDIPKFIAECKVKPELEAWLKQIANDDSNTSKLDGLTVALENLAKDIG